MNTLTDSIPATPGWYWYQSHHDNFVLVGPHNEVFNYRSYLDLCWNCGSAHINPEEKKRTMEKMSDEI